jgi:hypothetical protein
LTAGKTGGVGMWYFGAHRSKTVVAPGEGLPPGWNPGEMVFIFTNNVAVLGLENPMLWPGVCKEIEKTEVSTMAVLRVGYDNGRMRLGSYSRQATTASGCNEPFRNVYWCPKKRWFSKEPCPFVNRQECMNFTRFCGGI